MKKRIINTLCVTALLSGMSANALEMKVPNMSMPKIQKPSLSSLAAPSEGNKDAMKAQITKVISSSDSITTSFDNAVLNLVSILSTKEDVLKLKQTKAELLKTASTKEKDAVEAKFIEDAQAQLLVTLQQQNISQEIKGLSAQKRQLLADSTYNVFLASLGYLDLANEAMNLVNQLTADPMTAATMGGDLKSLKKVATNLPSQGKSAAQVGAGIIKVAIPAGITIPKPTSSSAKAKPLAQNEFLVMN